MVKAKVLIGMTGSFGMLSMPMYLQIFRSAFSEIKVIMTESAKEFIPAETISLIAGPIYSHLFPLTSTPKEFCHVQLARWADLFVVIPATANILAEAASGMTHSLLSSTILCHHQPILFFPNMNPLMWNHPATQRNVAMLKEFGHQVIISQKEQMGFEYASGQFIEGKFMMPPHEIVEILQNEIHRRSEDVILDETWLSN